MKKFVQYIPFLLILSLTILLFIKVNEEGKQAGQGLVGDSPMVGRQVADMELETLFPEGGKINSATYQGKFTVVNLFASWCIACLYEHKLFSRLKDNKDVNLVGISWRDKAEDTKGWLEQNGNPYDVVGLDSQGKYGILMGVTGIPETFVVNKEGKIIKHIRGTIGVQDIAEIKEEAAK